VAVELSVPKNITYFTPEHLYHGVILELFKDFPELVWLTGPLTLNEPQPEIYHKNQNWVKRLIQNHCIEPEPEGIAYIELEKALNAVILFTIIYDGRHEAYEFFIKPQRENNSIQPLQYADFKWLSHLTRKVTRDQMPRKQAVRAVILYLAFCHSAKAIQKASYYQMDTKFPDHLYQQIMQNNDTVINAFFPSFINLYAETRELLKSISCLAYMPYKELYYYQGGAELIAKFEKGLAAKLLTVETMDFAFIIEICRFAARQSYIHCLGSAALHQASFNTFKQIYQLTQEINYACNS
jgi:hypothetical protein